MIVFPRLGVSGQADFLVDTGADRTVLMQEAAEEIGVDTSSLRRQAIARGVGGALPVFQEPARLAFDAPGEALYVFDLPLLIAPQAPGGARLPSLLGLDVLRHCRLVLDPKQDELTLEFHSADQILPY